MSESFVPTPFVLGVATGLRSMIAVNVLATSGSRRLRLGAAAALAGEVLTDKLPFTPSRLRTGPLLARLALGTAVGFAAARRSPRVDGPGAGALSGFVGAGLGSFAGAGWRSLAARRFGRDFNGALLEDAVALAIGTACARLAATSRRRDAQSYFAPVPAGPVAKPDIRPTNAW